MSQSESRPSQCSALCSEVDVDWRVREWTNGLSVPADHPSDQCVHASEVPGGVPGPVSGSKNFLIVVFLRIQVQKLCYLFWNVT